MSRLLLALALGLMLGGPPLQWAAGLFELGLASAATGDAGNIFDPNGRNRADAGGIFDPNGGRQTEAGSIFDPDG